MTPARSLAASVIALGFASSLTAPLPAFAAPAPCEGAENYAAQSGAEMLRLDRLAWHTNSDSEQPSTKSSPGSPARSSSASAGSSGSSSSGSPRRESKSVTDTAQGLLGSDSDFTTGDLGNSGEGVTGFLSGTGDLLKSVTNGAVTAPGGPLNAGSGGQGGGGPVEESGSSVSGVGLGETRTAMIADARTNAVAVGRMVDGKGPLSKLLIQAAPPNSADASRHTSPGKAGPFGLGAGDLGTHAAWDPAMACGRAFGEAAHSSAALKHVDLLGGDLIHVTDPISGRSATALARSGNEARSVATATLTAGRLNLAAGKIKVRVLHSPTLTASMGTDSGGAVVYRPAQLEVTWPGGKSKTLNTAGDSVDIAVGGEERSTESTPLGGPPELDGLLPASPLPLPNVPGIPSLATPDTESAPAAGGDVTVRISVGAAHQATRAHAIAAKASAIQIAIVEGGDGSGYGKGGHSKSNDRAKRNDQAKSDDHSKSDDRDKGDGHANSGYGDVSSSVVAEVSLGMLEAAAVAPEAAGGNSGTGNSGTGNSGTGNSGTGNSGAGGSAALPITGPQASLIAVGGIGLLVAGGVALLVGRRRRRTLS
jgi:LPXTG-motif cell wall-anchored protein